MKNWLGPIIDWLFLEPLPRGERTLAEAHEYLAQFMPQRVDKMLITKEIRDGDPVFVATDVETKCTHIFGARKRDFSNEALK